MAVLIIRHTDHKSTDAGRQEKLDAYISVDSGQCGFYDLPIFRKKTDVLKNIEIPDWIDNEDGKWYGMCCTITCDKDADVIPGGVVSSSGYGDGSYECFVDKDENGQVTGATLVFIGESDDEEED